MKEKRRRRRRTKSQSEKRLIVLQRNNWLFCLRSTLPRRPLALCPPNAYFLQSALFNQLEWLRWTNIWLFIPILSLIYAHFSAQQTNELNFKSNTNSCSMLIYRHNLKWSFSLQLAKLPKLYLPIVFLIGTILMHWIDRIAVNFTKRYSIHLILNTAELFYSIFFTKSPCLPSWILFY